MMETTFAPWTDAQVEQLRQHQAERKMHPYTCGYCRDVLDLDGILEPRTDGWFCPEQDKIVQDWAWIHVP